MSSRNDPSGVIQGRMERVEGSNHEGGVSGALGAGGDDASHVMNRNALRQWEEVEDGTIFLRYILHYTRIPHPFLFCLSNKIHLLGKEQAPFLQPTLILGIDSSKVEKTLKEPQVYAAQLPQYFEMIIAVCGTL